MYFFFQAEDGIRDRNVTGVQTCALPISRYEGEIYSLIVFMVLGLAMMAAAADLILLFLAIEFVSLISYVLAGALKGDQIGRASCRERVWVSGATWPVKRKRG